jgi:hypothetical protein
MQCVRFVSHTSPTTSAFAQLGRMWNGSYYQPD